MDDVKEFVAELLAQENEVVISMMPHEVEEAVEEVLEEVIEE